MRVLLVVCCLAALVPAAALAGARHVRLSGLSPAVVHGTGFAAKERVIVTIRTSASTMRTTAVSTATGTFTARFGRAITGQACRGYAVSAVGAKGDRAAWKTAPRTCGPELAP